MNFLSEKQFLEHFEKGKSRTYDQFFNTAKVRTSKHLIPLKEYIKDKDVSKENMKLLFDNIQDRDAYLKRFYHLSLRVEPDRFSMSSLHHSALKMPNGNVAFNSFVALRTAQPFRESALQMRKGVKPMKNKHMNNNAETTYKNIIRNLHWKDILKNTKSGIDNVPTYMDVLEDLYLNDIIDYKIVTPSSLHYMKEGRLGSVFSSYYFRASIMNPYLVYSLNQSILKGTKIFTPTLGWTSYLYGFLEDSDNVIEYVGTDVIPSVCSKTAKFAKTYYKGKNIDILCEPSENLLLNKSFMRKYQEHFDVVFFSPPYYQLEKYPGKNQSIVQYKTYEEWLEKYWEATIKLCHYVLQKGGRLCYILSGYGQGTKPHKEGSDQYDLLTDMNKITRQYFKLLSTQPMYNKDVHVTEHKETNEKIMVFVK